MEAPRIPYFDFVVDAPGAAATKTKYVYVPDELIVTGVAVTAGTTIAADPANKLTVTLTDIGTAGAGADVIATVTSDTGVASSAAKSAVNRQSVVSGNAPFTAKIARYADLSGKNALVAGLGYGYKKTAGANVGAGRVLEIKAAAAGTLNPAQVTITVYARPGKN